MISSEDVCHSSCGNDLDENFYCTVVFIITVNLFIALPNGWCFTEQFLYSPKLLSGLEMVKSNVQDQRLHPALHFYVKVPVL